MEAFKNAILDTAMAFCSRMWVPMHELSRRFRHNLGNSLLVKFYIDQLTYQLTGDGVQLDALIRYMHRHLILAPEGPDVMVELVLHMRWKTQYKNAGCLKTPCKWEILPFSRI